MVEQMNIFRNEPQLWLLLCLIFHSNFNYSLLTNTNTNTKQMNIHYMYVGKYIQKNMPTQAKSQTVSDYIKPLHL